MKQNIEIEVPAGFEAKYNPETQTVEMIKKSIDYPRSWKEFCDNYKVTDNDYYISGTSTIKKLNPYYCLYEYEDKNICSSKEEAEAFLALMQLRMVRNYWLKGWNQDNYYKEKKDSLWIKEAFTKDHGIDIMYFPPKIYVFAISNDYDKGIIVKEDLARINYPLSFPTKEMADNFLKYFKDLIEIAKPLL